jgi:cytochrome c oxidase subunit II
MPAANQPQKRRVLIASSHGLFAQGLRSLLHERQGENVEIIGVVSNLPEALDALDKLGPDLIIVDYDDEALNRDEFLARFIEGERKLRVVLLSLQSGKEAIVYDRRTLAAAQIDDWLEEWNYQENSNLALRGIAEQNKKPKNRSGGMQNRSKSGKHFLIVGILVVISTFVVAFILQRIRLLPEAASAQATSIDKLFRGEFLVIAFLFSLIVVFMVYSIFVFRRKKGDTTDATHVTGNTRLEITWTVLPLLTVLFFAVWGGQSLRDVTRAEPDPLVVNVIGQQFAWRFEYPQPSGDAVVSDKLYLPVDKPVLLQLSSLDVIHSFWVPEFRVKQDALPGGEAFVRPLRIKPTVIGNYKLRCAELCGAGHTQMESDVIVTSQVDFDSWLAGQSNLAADPVARGQKVAKNFGCLGCHSVDGSKLVGPTWKGLFGSEVPLQDGSRVNADEEYLRESIVNPGAKIHQDYPSGVMLATYKDQMTAEQINDVIEFIKSLK